MFELWIYCYTSTDIRDKNYQLNKLYRGALNKKEIDQLLESFRI